MRPPSLLFLLLDCFLSESFSSLLPPLATPTLFPYTTLFRSRLALLPFLISCLIWLDLVASPTKRSEERFSRNAETDLVCRLLLEKKKGRKGNQQFHDFSSLQSSSR